MGLVACGSSLVSSFPSLRLRAVRASFSSSSSFDHVSFVKEVAAFRPPEHLQCLLNMLQARGETIVAPSNRRGLIPLAIPLSENGSGALTALLRWPTAPPEMEMPVVEVHKYGVRLLAKSVDQFIHRILVEEDAKDDHECNSELFNLSAKSGIELHKKGDFAESQTGNVDAYLLKKVGLFPDILERKAAGHLEKGDQVSALVTGEFYTRKEHFPGFARPFVFYAEILLKVGRVLEAKDAARVALKSPWWTLGDRYENVASIAQWEDEQIEYIKEKVSDEGRHEDLKKGKALEQVALDQAAFLLDLASTDGTWPESQEKIAKCYEEAGLHDIAKFVSYSG
ncbi:protein IN CHLOROPLAST ATPASE BIOGENESIS, chloroplastic-like [Nymphaea colorata]|nr:protein IN CHLOROPLAST ATPASE BIOGENESIS, chloroplastic-like [Nymphaea colorata]